MSLKDFKPKNGYEKVPPKKGGGQEPAPKEPKKEHYKTAKDYSIAYDNWKKAMMEWERKMHEQEQGKKKKEKPAPKKPQFTASKSSGPVKGKLTTGEKGRISKRMAKRHTNIKGGTVNISPHEMTLNQLFKNLR
tara:strand:- start:2130 stop:2531 length:402 start_codon:yes stop_codon:yes gene_type:complete